MTAPHRRAVAHYALPIVSVALMLAAGADVGAEAPPEEEMEAAARAEAEAAEARRAHERAVREAEHADNHGEPTDAELRRMRAEIRRLEAEERRADAALAEETRRRLIEDARRAGPARSLSMGHANRGFLRNGVPLASSETIHVRRSAHNQNYGTAELVALIEYGARAVARLHPGSRLAVGDLSQQGGGRIRPHRSHRSGRDADIGFYMLDADSRPLNDPGVFVRMGRDGTGTRRGVQYVFDTARNWTFVEALVTHPTIHAQYIFIARPLIEQLLGHARRVRANSESIERARRVLHQPSRGAPHWGHFHLRIYCASDDRPSCVDDPPFHPWVREQETEQTASAPTGGDAQGS